MKMQNKEIGEVVVVLNEVRDDNSVPKNVRIKVENIENLGSKLDSDALRYVRILDYRERDVMEGSISEHALTYGTGSQLRGAENACSRFPTDFTDVLTDYICEVLGFIGAAGDGVRIH